MKLVKEICLSHGFDDVGIADATLGTPHSASFLQAIESGYFEPLSYMQATAEVRADIQALMPTAKSVVVVIKNYYPGDHPEDPNQSPKISRYAWGGDYHQWFKKKLRKIRAEIIDQLGPANIHIFNDTGPVLERAWAERAGLGFIGKSGMFIHRKLGTWVFIGGFVTDLSLTPDKPSPKNYCGSCTACIQACPTQAIVAPGRVDARLCLTTWSIERPLSELASDPRFAGHDWGFGCDICQEVCPWNKFETLTDELRFLGDPPNTHLNLSKLPENLSGLPLARSKKEGLERNYWRAKAKKVY